MKLTLICWIFGGLAFGAGTLTFEEKTKEIDGGVDADTVVMDFPFKNESDEDVIIDRYDASCSCIDAKIKGAKLFYAPGESGVIRASFDMSNFTGTVDKTVAVWLKGDVETKPSIVLTTRVNIPVLVEVEPKSLIWELGGKPEPKTVTLTMNHTEPIRIKSISGADSRFTQVQKTIEEGKKYEVVVTPASTDKVGMGVVHIETDCSIARYRSHRIFMVIRQNLPATTKASAKP